jgi:hypothetical protein
MEKNAMTIPTNSISSAITKQQGVTIAGTKEWQQQQQQW